VILFLAIFPLENYDFHLSKGIFHGRLKGKNSISLDFYGEVPIGSQE
jgi:hypothetical protein